MKIYTKVIFEWDINLQKYVEIETTSYKYEGDVALCKGGDNGGDQTTTIRYAPYIESHHDTFLNLVKTKVDATINSSPFTGYTNIEVDDAFFGAGYLITSFPALYDMYGKFMAGLDIEVLYAQIFEDTVNAPAINNLVSAEAVLLDDDIEANSIPRFQVGMRDINSVMSSSYVVGKAMIEDARVKSISKFSAGLKYQMIPVASERWRGHLEWNKGVVMSYAEIMKLYYSAKMDIDDKNYSMAVKNLLWPFTVLEYQRAALGALQGAITTETDVKGASKGAKAISGALSGAAMGAMAFPASPLLGALGGGLLGLGAGLLM